VELVHGSHTGDLWPRPGRVLIASRSATFEQLATAIDDALARWDRNHSHEFTRADGTIITPHRWWDGEEPDQSLDGAKIRLGRLWLSEQFAYVFDLGDNWQHLCTVGPKLADPMETLGTVPDRPLPCWGWGDIPDQYGRRWPPRRSRTGEHGRGGVATGDGMHSNDAECPGPRPHAFPRRCGR